MRNEKDIDQTNGEKPPHLETIIRDVITDDQEIAEIFNLISNGFSAVNSSNILSQSMNYAELVEEAQNPNVRKIVIRNESSQIIAYANIINNEEDIPWLDIPDFKSRLGLERSDRIGCIGCIVVEASQRGSSAVEETISAIGQECINLADINESEGRKFAAIYDCAEENKNLPELVKYVVNKNVASADLNQCGEATTILIPREYLANTAPSSETDKTDEKLEVLEVSDLFLKKNNMNPDEIRAFKISNADIKKGAEHIKNMVYRSALASDARLIAIHYSSADSDPLVYFKPVSLTVQKQSYWSMAKI